MSWAALGNMQTSIRRSDVSGEALDKEWSKIVPHAVSLSIE